jgi:hypothetical protein
MNKKQFFYLFNNSLKITIDGYDNSIFYIWNKSIDRQLKYNRLFNVNKQIKYEFNQKDILFGQDLKNKYIWYNYEKIYLKLKENIDYKDLNINELIDGWLMDDTSPSWKSDNPYSDTSPLNNWKLYSIGYLRFNATYSLKDDTNWKLYTSGVSAFRKY